MEKSFRILEKQNSLKEEDFIEELYNKHSDNEGKEFYEEINKRVLEKTNNFILPKKIASHTQIKEEIDLFIDENEMKKSIIRIIV